MMETEEKYKVVIVDDERTAIDALRRELEPYREFEVKGIAGNGAKGKKMIMELHPDLLFLDVELPDTLGLNLLSEIREDILWDMKVVFYTSYDKYLLQALRESAFDFLLKPFEAEDLKVIMERYRKAMTSAALPLLPSFASSISALMPQQGMFMISTVTGFKLLRLEEIGFFEYLKDKRQWQVVLFNQTCLNLKRNTKAEDIAFMKEKTETAKLSPIYGFDPDTTNVKTEQSAIGNVVSQYASGLLTGELDPEEYIPKMQEEMKDAGMDNFIAEVQTQLDAWEK